MGELNDSAAGMRLVQAAIRAMADNDEREALRLLSEADPTELRWAATTLLAQLYEVFRTANKGSRHRTRIALRHAADEIEGDLLDTQLRILTRKETNDG